VGFYKYLYKYTDTPGTLAVQNIDVFVIPAVISAFLIMGIIPTIVYFIFQSKRQKITFVSISTVGIFFTFVFVLKRIIEN